jgi:hypothetical protein
VTVRLKTPSTQTHHEQWAAILERVEGDIYDVDEPAHLIQDARRAQIVPIARKTDLWSKAASAR